MSEGEAQPLYAHRDVTSIHVFLPEEYSSTDPTKWLNTASSYLDSRGFQTERHEIRRSHISAEPCTALRVFFAPKEHELRRRGHVMEDLHQQLNTKYTTAVYARFARGYAFDEVVGSQVRLASALGTTNRIDLREHLDWLRERRIEHHTINDIVCFTLPAGCDPETWQYTLAKCFGAFVLKEDTNWH